MKKLILISVMLLSGIIIRAGEVFPKSDAIWNFRASDDKTLMMGLIGDTMINDITYQKLAMINDTLPIPETVDFFIGEIRKDDYKIWLRTKIVDIYNEPIPDEEILLYDFSKNKGDKIIFPIYIIRHSNNIYFQKTEGELQGEIIDITTDEKGRKHYIIHFPPGNEEWIEGIGTITRIPYFYTETMTGNSTNYSEITLQCFKHNGKIEYQYNHPGSRCQSCFCEHQYVQIQEEVSGTIKIYAVSEQKEIRLELPETSLPVHIDTYNLSGQLIYNHQINEKYFSFDVQSAQSGIYIYRINQFGKPLQSGKIIIL